MRTLMLSNPPTVAIPHPPHSTGPYFPRVWAQVAAYAPPGTVVLVRIPGTYEARVVRTETEYRLLAAGLTMPECYVTAEANL